MPERPRGYDDIPAEVKYGLISQANYDALLEAMERKDFNAWGRLAVELCEDNVPLFGVLFLRKHAMPHFWKEWARIQRNPRILVRVARGHGKALALDTPVPTPSGWTTMGALQVGDYVFDEHGLPTRVVDAKDPETGKKCFRVRFNDGSSIVADADHLWMTKTKGERQSRKAGPGSLRSTLEIQRSLLVKSKGKKWNEYNHSIEVAKPWNLPARDLPVHPYVLGAWLGDGASRAARLTSADEEVVEHIRAAGYPVIKGKERYDWSLSDGKMVGPHKASLHRTLRQMGLLGNKHIPLDYLVASAEQRMALLQGLMDTDGTCHKGGQCSFTSTNRSLADSVYRLAGSLGLVPHLYEKHPSIPGRPEAVCATAYEVSFITKVPVFRLKRKLDRQVEATARSYTGKTRTIVAVEPIESVPVRCIGVESPYGLFLAGNGSIPTHNTDLWTFCTLVHRICYSVIPNSKHEDPRVLAIFETRPRANVRMLSIRQVFETGGPGGFIGKIFRGAATFPGGEPTPWADMSIPQIAERFGEWNNTNINLPHPRRLAKPDPNVASLSPGEGSVGFQPRLILADDVVGPKTAASAAKRRALSQWWNDAIGPMLKGYTRLWGPHTVFHPEDLNFELGRREGTYDLMEMKALDRFPDRDDFELVRDERGTITDIHLTPKGETLVPLWGCPEYTEADCPWRDPKHVDPNEGGIMHRPVKDLIFQWVDKPLVFASQYMHIIRRTDDTSIKPWMLRFFCETPNCPDGCWGKVASWHTEWDNWLTDQPDAGLEKHAPTIVLFNKDGVTDTRGESPIPVERSVHGWDLAFGKKRVNDRTVCCRLYRTLDKRFFALYQKGQWKHDTVWRMVVLNAVTDPVRRPQEVGLEVDAEQIYPQEVRKLMRAMNVADRFKLTEIHRTLDKDIVLQNSGLPITMSNGFFYVNIHDEDAIMELLSVTPDQNGGHDDVLDASVNAYGRLRSAGKLNPGSLGKPLPAA